MQGMRGKVKKVGVCKGQDKSFHAAEKPPIKERRITKTILCHGKKERERGGERGRPVDGKSDETRSRKKKHSRRFPADSSKNPTGYVWGAASAAVVIVHRKKEAECKKEKKERLSLMKTEMNQKYI